MTDGLKAKYRAAIIDILAANERVERAVLFGSRAMETFTPTSDVDIALFGDHLTLTDQANLAIAIDELPMAQRVDLLLHKTVNNDALRKHIEQHGAEWYRRQAREKMTGSPWKRMPLGDFVTLQRGHDLPDAIRRPGNKPVLGSFGVTGWHDEARAAGPGVTVGRSGASFGVVSYSPVDYWPLNTALYVVDFHGNDQRFAYYFLKQVDFRTYNSGSAQPSLNRNFIHPIPVDVPPLPEQRAIAHILGTLDDKIELNRRMNKTLEEMARTLFKSWFIDFDPVHAKAALRNVTPNLSPLDWTVERAHAYLDGMDPSIAALFPDSFVDSELGEIPEGWKVGKLGNVAEHPRRAVQPNNMNLETPYIALEHMPKRCIALSEWDTAAGVGSNKYEFRRGEFLFGKLRPYFHKVGIAPVGGVCSTDIVVVAPNAHLWSSFILFCISSDEFVAYTDQASTGTRMPRTSWKTMGQFEICLPTESMAALFQEIAQPMLDRIIANCHEARPLATLRDTLLPKLMSGELRLTGREEG